MRTTLLLIFISASGALHGATLHNIIVDQFGYRTAAEKYVIFCDPQTGQFSELPAFTPGTQFEVRRQSDSAVVFTGTITAWNGGATDTVSGDKAWQGQFNSLSTPGTYFVSLPGGSNPGGRSHSFELRDDVYAPVLKASARTFFYQRCGLAVPAANGGNWSHPACHCNANQDLAASLWNGAAAGSPRDIHGGWHDAGDYGKYVEFTHGVLWDLMHAVEWYPAAFSDATNIPESGNGVPDLLDEVKRELDWMMRMQFPDGSVSGKIGITDFSDGSSPPNNSITARYYTQASTGATATLASSCALGARLFASYGAQYPGYAASLQTAALNAWNFLASHPNPINYNNSGLVNADSNLSPAVERQRRVSAAAELYALTGNAAYRSYVDANYNSSTTTEGSHQPILSNYFETGASMSLQRGLVSYALAPGATAAVVSAIKTALKNGIEGNIMGQSGNDPYRAFMWSGHYCWGSNQLKANWGMLPLWGMKLNVDATRTAAYKARAEEYLHYFHGRNPLNLVYLTNMGSKGANAGAERTIMEIYHSWFQDGSSLYDGAASTYGPAPGFLAGGPNQFYGAGVSPPMGQPPMKSYADWNAGWPQNSWEVTEPAIYYQATYTFLLSAFSADFKAGRNGDFNADRNSDILLRHPSSGDVKLWLMR